jgi:hypothetical protein
LIIGVESLPALTTQKLTPLGIVIPVGESTEVLIMQGEICRAEFEQQNRRYENQLVAIRPAAGLDKVRHIDANERDEENP